MKSEPFDIGLAWPTLFDAVGFGLVLVDANAEVRLWNGWLTRHSGVSAQAAIGQPLESVFDEGLPASFMTALNNALHHKLPVVLSSVLHRSLLPLHAQLPASASAQRIPHGITMTPLVMAPWGPCCLIQITDASRAMSREKVLQKTSDRLLREIMTDSLTGAYSRGFFDKFLQQELARAQRQGTRLSVIMIDIDYFKNYNDEYGHPAGDRVLIAVVRALQGVLLRSTDKLARYGGEEFVVILPDCALLKAQAIAEHLRAAVFALNLAHRKSKVSDQLTISLGVSTMESGQSCTAQSLLEAADHALYAAKNNGRNGVRYAACQPGAEALA